MASSSGGIGFLVAFGVLALAYANGGCDLSSATSADGDSGDGTFDFSPGESADGTDGLATCDGVVVIESASETVEVPGDTGSLDTSASTACAMGPGQGDDQAVAVLQNALKQCNGQAVDVDGDYGTQTAQAVAAVQRQAGVTEDGKYGPVTLQVMRWPATESGGCVGNMSQAAEPEEASSELPLTG